MKKRFLKFPRGYNPKSQTKVGIYAAQLDDQLVRLKKQIEGLTVEQLEWQMKPGMNTVGMLLAHLALVEVWWIKIAPSEILWDPDGKALVQKICGIEDDGLPLAPDGLHPSYLKGFTIEKYLAIIDRSRRSINSVMKKWQDKNLDKFYNLGKDRFSYGWTLYHVLEHFAGHYGQILLLKHLMRDAGIIAPPKP